MIRYLAGWLAAAYGNPDLSARFSRREGNCLTRYEEKEEKKKVN